MDCGDDGGDGDGVRHRRVDHLTVIVVRSRAGVPDWSRTTVVSRCIRG